MLGSTATLLASVTVFRDPVGRYRSVRFSRQCYQLNAGAAQRYLANARIVPR